MMTTKKKRKKKLCQRRESMKRKQAILKMKMWNMIWIKLLSSSSNDDYLMDLFDYKLEEKSSFIYLFADIDDNVYSFDNTGLHSQNDSENGYNNNGYWVFYQCQIWKKKKKNCLSFVGHIKSHVGKCDMKCFKDSLIYHKCLLTFKMGVGYIENSVMFCWNLESQTKVPNVF